MLLYFLVYLFLLYNFTPIYRRMQLEIEKIVTPQQLEIAYAIRTSVFVEEQKVAMEEELDEFEHLSVHLLARKEQGYVGTCRYRLTEKGYKLERFAVLKSYRMGGVGAALVRAALQEVIQATESQSKKIYLHAQVSAIPFYEKLGFEAEGEIFDECAILHRVMNYKHSKITNEY